MADNLTAMVEKNKLDAAAARDADAAMESLLAEEAEKKEKIDKKRQKRAAKKKKKKAAAAAAAAAAMATDDTGSGSSAAEIHPQQEQQQQEQQQQEQQQQEQQQQQQQEEGEIEEEQDEGTGGEWTTAGPRARAPPVPPTLDQIQLAEKAPCWCISLNIVTQRYGICASDNRWKCGWSTQVAGNYLHLTAHNNAGTNGYCTGRHGGAAPAAAAGGGDDGGGGARGLQDLTILYPTDRERNTQFDLLTRACIGLKIELDTLARSTRLGKGKGKGKLVQFNTDINPKTFIENWRRILLKRGLNQPRKPAGFRIERDYCRISLNWIRKFPSAMTVASDLNAEQNLPVGNRDLLQNIEAALPSLQRTRRPFQPFVAWCRSETTMKNCPPPPDLTEPPAPRNWEIYDIHIHKKGNPRARPDDADYMTKMKDFVLSIKVRQTPCYEENQTPPPPNRRIAYPKVPSYFGGGYKSRHRYSKKRQKRKTRRRHKRKARRTRRHKRKMRRTMRHRTHKTRRRTRRRY